MKNIIMALIGIVSTVIISSFLLRAVLWGIESHKVLFTIGSVVYLSITVVLMAFFYKASLRG